MKNIIDAKKVSKSYENIKILKGIDISVKLDEFVAIMGKSGSGKSTLLYCLSGMDTKTEGEIYFKEENICKLSDEKISRLRLFHMGFIFQQSHLLKTLSIYDNIVLPALKAKKESRGSINAYAKDLMQRMEIDAVAGNDIKKVSGGQLQRAAICRALMNQPDVIFADEPTGALDSSVTKEIMDIMNEINQNKTAIIMVTHDSKVAARADRVIFLSDGMIKEELVLGKYQKHLEKERVKKVNYFIEMQDF